ncbi:uncharacterized protein [Asterias amurensis]|uniref:uncharacterized protein n=1 Tax=Asterias amurensis TaxID=7602 RepID=UPI003AB740D1
MVFDLECHNPFNHLSQELQISYRSVAIKLLSVEFGILQNRTNMAVFQRIWKKSILQRQINNASKYWSEFFGTELYQRDVILDREDVAKFILNIKNEAERVTNILEHNHATWNHVILLRNILMALLFLQGAPRSGVVSNMTVGEFLGSKEVLDGNLEIHKIVTVSHHKTRGTYGPQLVPLDKPLQRWMQIYYELGRPLTPALNGTQEEDPFFVGIGGLAVKKVAQELQRLWDRHDFTGKINPNIIRKTVATLNQGSNLQPSEKTGVSRLMGHLETTQKKYYTANQAPVEAIKYKRTIHQLLYENTPGGSANDSDPEQTKKLRKFSSKLFSHEQDITLLEEVNRLRALEEAKPGKSRNLKDLVRQMMSEAWSEYLHTYSSIRPHAEVGQLSRIMKLLKIGSQ